MKYSFIIFLLILSGCGSNPTKDTQPNSTSPLLDKALSGDAQAQEQLAIAYSRGEIGSKIDTVKAEFWYCQSFLKNGNKNAGRMLGMMMAGTSYYIDRKPFFDAKGYKHKVCNEDQLISIDPSLKKHADFLAKK